MQRGKAWGLVSLAMGLAACGGITSIDTTSSSQSDSGHDDSGGSTGFSDPGGTGAAEGLKGTCGNGVVDAKQEMCDGSNLNGWTCASATMFARPNGVLTCASTCVVNTRGCYATGGTGGASTGTGGGPGVGGGFGSGGVFGGGNGGSFGDPHIFTIDGLEYEFQAVGEFVLAQDPSDPGFVIQVRQSPFGAYSNLAVNTAAAALVGGDRVTFHAGEPASVRVDGVLLRVNGTVRLPHGGTLTNRDGAYLLTWPTGEELVVLAMWKELLNVSFHQARAGSRRSIQGLVGAANGRRGAHLTARSGEVVTLPPPVEQLYGTFGNSWRVTDQEALFDYAPGENTDTFTDRSFPHVDPEAMTPALPRIVDAREKCKAAGVTDTSALRACSLDVAITGNVGFARAAVSNPSRSPR